MTGDVVHGVRQVPLVVMAARPQDEHRAGHVSALIGRVFRGMSGSPSAAVSGQADRLHQGCCWRSVGVGVVVCVVSSSTAVSGQADRLHQGCCWRSVGVGVVVCVVSSSTAVSGQADRLSQGCCWRSVGFVHVVSSSTEVQPGLPLA